MTTFVALNKNSTMRRIITYLYFLVTAIAVSAQINTDQVMQVGRNALYFEDYMLSIQYFNQVISAKPYLAHPYFFRALAKLNLDDFQGAIDDATIAIERNPFITDAYELRAVAYQNLGRPSQAIADYDHVLSMLPENRGILFNKALAQEESKDYDGAAATFETLLNYHKGYDNGYVGRARLRLETGDTVGALADVDKALQLNKNSVNAYLIRADVAINSNRDFAKALEDMNEAIRLQPKYAGFFINRAFLRHNLDDYYGAMGDYDYAIQLDPMNYVGYYNRALLLSEVRDFDKALLDLDKVIQLRGIDYRALYNRAIIRKEKRDFKGAIEDIEKVIDAYPSLAAGYFLRSEIKRDMGDNSAKADFDRSMALARQGVSKTSSKTSGAGPTAVAQSGKKSESKSSSPFDDDILRADDEPQEIVAARFTSLLTIGDNMNLEQEYNNKSIRGKVQDRNIAITIEPMFTVSFYNSPTELRPNPEYIKEVDELNRTRALRFMLQVTNNAPALTDPDEIKRHFDSVEYYNSYLSSHTPRAVDYFGRGMDFITLRNYEAAIADFNRAIDLAPDFTMAFFMRSIARTRQLEAPGEPQSSDSENPSDASLTRQQMRAVAAEAMADIDQVIKLSPEMAIAFYNKGVMLIGQQDFTSALSALNKAIELNPSFGEAYYNRGYVYFKLGNREHGSADLSKAGELGVVPSYNLLKRMSR